MIKLDIYITIVEPLITSQLILTHFLKRQEYKGNEKLVVGNGRKSLINSDVDFRPLFMNHVRHVPKITKNLLSVSQFTKDNNVIAEFYS